MKRCIPYICFAAALLLSLPALAEEKAKPVRMGCGIMTFDTVPGWGLRPDGTSARSVTLRSRRTHRMSFPVTCE